MRHPQVRTWTLLSATLAGSFLWADTPVKPGKSSFSAPVSTKPATTPPSVAETKLLPRLQNPDATPEEPKPIVDYSIKAASIEVTWLQDPLTYPLHLRANFLPGQEVISLTGYVPSEAMKLKAVALARMSAGTITLHDELMVQPAMSLGADVSVDPQQAYIVQDRLDAAAPGIGKSLQISVDAQGITTVTGRVDELSDRLKIIRALQGIPGCTAIKYDLRVCAPGTPGAPLLVKTSVVLSTASPKAGTAPMIMVETKPTVIQAASPVMQPPTPQIPVQTVPAKTDSSPNNTTSAFPKLIGFSSTAKQPSPSIAEIEKRAKPVRQSAIEVLRAGTQEAGQITVPVTDSKIVSSSLSGMFPPGMSGRSMEPAILLGSPIVRSSMEQRMRGELDLNVMQTSAQMNASEIGSSSTTATPAGESTLIQLPMMPRLAR